MADAIISVVIEQISNLLLHEIGFLSSVREDVERLQAELKRMQCFLKDTHRKQDQDERVRNWVAEIRDLAYDADDVVDTFLLKVVNREAGMCKFINKFTANEFLHLHKIGTKIKSICARLAGISNSLQIYGIKFTDEGEGSSSSSEMQRRVRRTDPDDDEEDIISLDSTTKDVMAQLMKEEDQLRVVSIVGMGGLGKTTLAKKVYNYIDVKQHFDCCSWAFISQQYSPRDVLLGILMEVSPSAERSMIEDELVRTLKNVLKEKRYLLVLDDIWNEQAWDSLKQAFPKGKKGSKVLFTTRIKEVALYADPRSSPVEPPFLTDEQGWELLRTKAFLEDSAGNQIDMAEFERLGKEMGRKCGGLPLAIAVLGGLLANKSLKEWEVVERDISVQFIKLQQRNMYAGVNWILGLSYHDLPFRLKPCFLYLSQFPEDWNIRKKRLIRMWMAEGFIPQPPKGEGDETMEDVGEQYLEELVNRCMIQVSRRDHTGIGIKTCRMHDLMRDMCLLKAKEENFLAVAEPQKDSRDSSSSIFLPLTRRIAVHSSQHGRKDSFLPTAIPTKERGLRLRSLLYFDPNFVHDMTKHQVILIFKNFKLLRVLNLQNIFLDPKYVPGKIGNLIHLRYLGLEITRLDRTSMCMCFPLTTLPTSIGNMKSLYTLDLRDNSARIPDVLWKLECLRHLILSRDHRGKFRLDTLRNLETLKWVKAKNLIRNDAMLKLTNLRDLAIEFQTTEEAEVVLKSPIVELGRLRSLKMFIELGSSFSNWKLLLGCRNITKLGLEGTIPEDPRSPYQSLTLLPESLTKLTLAWTELKQDPMRILEKLPKLRYLAMHFSAYRGSNMVCSLGGFHQLEFLMLNCLEEVEEWEINEGAMPRLKVLYIMYLGQMKTIPEGLKFVTTIRTLVVCDHREEFERRVRVIDGVEGEDFDKVRHIPSITTNIGDHSI
ncbi:putative disease resistance protein At1g50180 [Ricinus communis]|uniref:putative disease resistance protein At1g50180 n=1 Tax=Ricinus communis TaxID=3988 RepID=UPI00201AD688|nr:putative disease resistance protein At1g50180 [Ricinus communis]